MEYSKIFIPDLNFVYSLVWILRKRFLKLKMSLMENPFLRHILEFSLIRLSKPLFLGTFCSTYHPDRPSA